MENKKKAASMQTTKNLVKVAREMFSVQGFADTSLERIAEEAGLTRGALYHHYKNKKDLFLAVLNQVQEDIGNAVEEGAMASDDIWKQLELGCIAFVENAILPENKRILLIDAPSAVGWQEWKDSDKAHSESHLEEQLRLIQSKGELAHLDVRLTTSMISGALNELAAGICEHAYIEENAISDCVRHLIKGFRKHG